MEVKRIKSIIEEEDLTNPNKLINFVSENPQNLDEMDLREIAEIGNVNREENSAFYTNPDLINEIVENLPNFDKDTIKILEPAVGVGNFLPYLIDKYKNLEKVEIHVNDIDTVSINLTRILTENKLPENVSIYYHNTDFLIEDSFKNEHFDLIIGNPPFQNVTDKNYSKTFNDEVTKSLSGFFLQKSLILADYVAMVMPKYFLSNPNFKSTRDLTKKNAIDLVIDFGEKGFKGVLIETISIFINTTSTPNLTRCISLTKNIKNEILQNKMTSNEYPYWLMYRSEWFDEFADRMKLGVFTSFRDRQVTKAILTSNSDNNIKVLKSRNISRDGQSIIEIPGYDSYITQDNLEKLNVKKFLNATNVFLVPNMTYYPRIVRKPLNTIVNGSVAILTPKEQYNGSELNVDIINTDEFQKFYSIARNYGTRSLNIDKDSVYFFGILKEKA